MSKAVLFIIFVLCVLDSSDAAYCTPTDTCWPSASDITQLSNSLSSGSRVLYWNGSPSSYGTVPFVSAVPSNSPGDQPLYGVGKTNMLPIYSRASSDTTSPCYAGTFAPLFCLVSTRNWPYGNQLPAFVAWPLTTADVQTLVNFATSKNMCIAVAGTGHDFLNRHTCPGGNGFFIRMSLFKQLTWSSNLSTVTVGVGTVFEELHSSAATNNRAVSSGWSPTVGVTGWSIGGGHGPYAPSFGLGVDNIVEVQIVTADGQLKTANSSTNSDLFSALRGGGGSTFGVITSITFQSYAIPTGGFTAAEFIYTGKLSDVTTLSTIIKGYTTWALSLDKIWGGLAFIQPTYSTGKYSFFGKYVYAGAKTDSEFTSTWTTLTSIVSGLQQAVNNYSNAWEMIKTMAPEYITPVDFFSCKGGVGGIPSVLVSRTTAATTPFTDALQDFVVSCSSVSCPRVEIYQSITGNTNSPQASNVSISPSFRTAVFHLVYGTTTASKITSLYTLGDSSYFSESAFTMSGTTWKERYWGSNYAKLLTVKQTVDPQNRFWCHNCVGSDAVTMNETFNSAGTCGSAFVIISYATLVISISLLLLQN